MRHTLTIFLAALSLLAFAEDPKPMAYTDFEAVNGKKGDAILDGLNALIKNHNVISYSALEDYYERTDFYADTLWDMYSTCRFTMAEANVAQKKLCDGWNKEHVCCQSWLGSGPMVSDLFNVYPTDARVNNLRSNYPYGVVDQNKGFSKDEHHHALGKLGTSKIDGGGSVVYEPDDRYKGDFARTYFYMVARYRENTLNSGHGSVMFVSNPTNFTAYSLSFLLDWHRQDPVSQKEINRNDSVNQIQLKRNPFIDYPYLVEYIWGDLKGQAVDFTQLVSSSDPSFVVDVSDGRVESTDPFLACATKTLTFPTLLQGESNTRELSFQGARLTHGVTITISGADASQFSVTPSSFTLAQMEAASKQTVNVTYHPTNNAIHNAELTISSEGANTVKVNLAGACAVEAQLMWMANCSEVNDPSADVSLAVGAPIENLPEAQTSCSTESPQFVGWSLKQINGTTDDVPEDLFSDALDAPAVTGNMTFYAVFARVTETGGGTPETISWTVDNANGWTESGMGKQSSYKVFVPGATLTSTEVDLSTLESVTFRCRTYQGSQYNIIDIYSNGEKLGSVDAVDKNMKDVEWTNTKDLTGKGTLVFSSTTNSGDGGPAVQSITIKSAGIKYVYDRYLTSCSGACVPTESEDISSAPAEVRAQKFIIDGRLLIFVNGQVFDVMGNRVE